MSLNRRRLLPIPDCNPELPQNALPDRRFLTMKKVNVLSAVAMVSAASQLVSMSTRGTFAAVR